MNALDSVFKAVIVHEDSSTGIHAVTLLNKLSSRLKNELGLGNAWQMDSQIWKFEWLQDAELQEPAMAGAVAADMIVISADLEDALPGCVRNWIENVLRRRQGRPLAIVALLAARRARWALSFFSPGIYLRRLARQYGADFFCNLNNAPPSESGIAAGLARFEDDAELPAAAVAADFGLRGCGIND